MTTIDLAEIEASLVRSLLTVEQGGAALLAYGGQPVALIMPLTGEPVIEHAFYWKGVHVVRSNDPRAEAAFPLDAWIVHQQQVGGRVFRRQVVVVDDWAEVPE